MRRILIMSLLLLFWSKIGSLSERDLDVGNAVKSGFYEENDKCSAQF